MAFTITIERESRWTFKTCSSSGASIGEGLAAGITLGSITLTDPSGKATELHYGGIGGGLGAGYKAKLGKINLLPPKVSVPIAPTWFKSDGLVFVTSNCPGQDLKRNDFSGPCAFIEIGAGAVVGYSELALLTGMQASFWEKMVGLVTPGLTLYSMVMSARGMILTRGWNAGAQLGISGIAYFGFMS